MQPEWLIAGAIILAAWAIATAISDLAKAISKAADQIDRAIAGDWRAHRQDLVGAIQHLGEREASANWRLDREERAMDGDPLGKLFDMKPAVPSNTDP